MSDKPIDLDAKRKAKEAETTNESPTVSAATFLLNMAPKFDPDTYFREIMEANRKAKAKEVEAKAKRNALTKRRYRIEDKSND